MNASWDEIQRYYRMALMMMALSIREWANAIERPKGNVSEEKFDVVDGMDDRSPLAFTKNNRYKSSSTFLES